MRSILAILIFTIPTVIISFTGGSFWPFFSYELYVAKPQHAETYQLWGLNKETSKKFRIRSTWVLWPVGPNGINQKMHGILSEKENEIKIKKILEYFSIDISVPRAVPTMICLQLIKFCY